MNREPEDAVDIGGFWIFGFLSVVLAVLKLTLAPYWSWWRVMLPLLAYLGHNALYILTALICFRWLKHEEEESTARRTSMRGTATTSEGCYSSSCFWITCSDISRDKAGATSGRAPEESRWWSCMQC